MSFAKLMAKPANLLVPMALFYLLLPGNLLEIKGSNLPLLGDLPIVRSLSAPVVHTLVFGLVLAVLHLSFPEYY